MTNPFKGKWTYRSFLNDPDVDTGFDKLEFGRGTIDIGEASATVLKGTIGGPGWSLNLHGSFGYGSPMQVRFQGKGIVGGEIWVYDYIGWLVPAWPNSDSTLQRDAIGSQEGWVAGQSERCEFLTKPRRCLGTGHRAGHEVQLDTLRFGDFP